MGGTPASGGSSATGGTSDSGGSPATGGTPATGGSPATGGTSASGGISASGGSSAAGGSTDNGGSTGNGGSSAAGGATGNGGSSGTGGSSGSGGSSAAGGSTAAGGSSGTGGSAGAGGTTPALACAAPLTPTNGNVTDFSDWDVTSGKWGNTSGLYGAVYDYTNGGTTATMKVSVDTFNKNLHFVGSLASGDFAGGGLSFNTCATVASFKSISFTIAGSAPGCDLELQIQTFDQRPTTQTPPGGCTANCYGFPSKGRIATPTATPVTITTLLSDFSKWSDANAAQVVAIQFQFTVPQTPDGGTAATCAVDMTIDDVKFVP
jgi:hypothetical protein